MVLLHSGRSRRRRRKIRLLFGVMFRLTVCNGFLSRCGIGCRPSLSTIVFSKFDDLMDEVLSNRGIPNTAESPVETKDAWRWIDWTREQERIADVSPLVPPSPVIVAMIRDRLVYVKRDDQARLPGSQISGNKARKMLALQRMDPAAFPSAIVSYGGPQSNSMLALAAVVHYQNTLLSLSLHDPRKKRFVYYTKILPRFLRNQPSGNLFRAVSLGMEMVELSAEDYTNMFGSEWGGNGEQAPIQLDPPVQGDSVWIPQGGACGMAVAGTKLLAQEILEFWIANGSKQPLSVCIPGGTCSTAVLVHRALKDLQSTVPNAEKVDIEVVVIPCIGDESYARRQMMFFNTLVFDSRSSHIGDIPSILGPRPKSGQRSTNGTDSEYFRFGEPDASIMGTFLELRDDYDLVFDLLYGAPAWTIMFRHWTSPLSHGDVNEFDTFSPINGRRIMYIHSGGLEGISSQMLRYKYKKLIDIDEIQLPGGRRSKI